MWRAWEDTEPGQGAELPSPLLGGAGVWGAGGLAGNPPRGSSDFREASLVEQGD